MNVIRCQKCGADCAEGTNFCRQCGSVIDPAPAQPLSEQATAILNQPDVATQRFEPRTTGPERGRLPQPVAESTKGSRRGILIGAFVLGVITVICVAAVLGLRHKREATRNLMYPGARTVVEMTGEGGRTLHLETSDSFAAVEEWYQKEMKPHKTMRLTSTSVVLKNDKTTLTIAAEDAKTNILIKVAP